MTLAPGTIINNRYRIVTTLGQGGMGAVYQAMDENLGIPVAVKENLFLTDEYARQFQREANILAGLKHPTLPRVGDYFTIPTQGQYLIMDYIDGEDLRQRIERVGILPEKEVILIGAVICDALTYLHTRRPSIIHRDIKPGNIKITPDGHISLVDFGLAKVMIGNQQTTTGARAMTPGYSPPEQYGSAPTDPRTDIYSLGATLYACLTGAIPEDGLARATGKSDLTPIRVFTPKTSKRLAKVIEEALSINSEDRFQKAEEFKAALLDAGGMDHVSERLSVLPPPPIPSSLSIAHELADEDSPELKPSSAKPRGQKRNSRPSAKRRKLGPLLPMSLLAASILTIFFLLEPGIPVKMRGLFFPPLPSPSVGQTVDASAVAAAQIETTQVPTPTETTIPEPTLTATFEPSATPTPTLTPSITATPMGGGFGQISFSSNRTGSTQIWIMNVDGSQQRPLTNIRDGACMPAWSPDGQKIAFISPCLTRRDRYEGSKIFILDVENGGDSYPLPVPPSPASDYDPAWSPDGDRIAFTSTRAGNPDIFIFNFRDNSLIQITEDRFPEKHPAWSPSGSQIAYVRDLTYSQLMIMSDSGEFKDRFSISGEVNDIWPAWSPDGSLIFFSQLDGGNVPTLFVQGYEDRKTFNSTRIPGTGQPGIGPVAQVSVSPDGNWLAFEGWPDGTNHDIFLMTINGANKIRLTTDRDFDFGASWRP